MMNTVYSVKSPQQGCHPDLARVVRKYQHSHYQMSISDQQRQLFKNILPLLANKPCMLDSGCGTAMSTTLLCQQYPDHFIIGIDKSAHRLNKHPYFSNNDTMAQIADNALLIQTNLIAFWLFASQSNLLFDKHFIFYPNPWPKAKHLARRFHGHPIFPHFNRISNSIEIRTNWLIYLEEMQLSLSIYDRSSTIKLIPSNKPPVSRFEKKYFQYHQPCYQLKTQQ